jgi:hypothetical protein
LVVDDNADAANSMVAILGSMPALSMTVAVPSTQCVTGIRMSRSWI